MQRATQGDIPAWQKSCSEADPTRTSGYDDARIPDSNPDRSGLVPSRNAPIDFPCLVVKENRLRPTAGEGAFFDIKFPLPEVSGEVSYGNPF
jgi:hypothetical protein